MHFNPTPENTFRQAFADLFLVLALVGVIMVCIIGVGAAFGGCATGTSGIRQGLTVTEGTLSAAGKALFAYDQQQQAKITARAFATGEFPKAHVMLMIHRSQVGKLYDALYAAQDLAQTVRATTQLVDEGKATSVNLGALTGSLAASTTSLLVLLADLGVAVPGYSTAPPAPHADPPDASVPLDAAKPSSWSRPTLPDRRPAFRRHPSGVVASPRGWWVYTGPVTPAFIVPA